MLGPVWACVCVVYVCVAYTWLCVCRCSCTRIQKPKPMSGAGLYHSLPYQLRQGLSLKCKLAVLDRLAGQGAVRITCLQAWVTGTHSYIWFFMRVLGTQTRVFMLWEQLFLPVKPPPCTQIGLKRERAKTLNQKLYTVIFVLTARSNQ